MLASCHKSMTIWPRLNLHVRRSVSGFVSVPALSLLLVGVSPSRAEAAPAGSPPKPAATPVAAQPTQPSSAPNQTGSAARTTATAPAQPVTSATAGVAEVAPTTAAEKRAAALAKDAMNKDYLAMTYPSAEKKLRRAMQICMDQNCSAPFRARLHRDIGIIYVVGLNRAEDGKDEFATSLTLDPTVAISADMNNDQAEKAFLEVKYTLFPETKPPPAPPAPATTEVDLGGTPATEDASSSESWREIPNWVSLGIQQDIYFHSSTKWVCNHTQYRCWDAAHVPHDYTSEPTDPNSNQIPGAKIKLATLRVLVGYERLLSKKFSVGLKLGMVVSGKAPRVLGDPAVVSVHGEARAAYYLGENPFDPSNKLRPYAVGMVGIAEVSSNVGVNITLTEQATSQTVLAWKRSGKFFLGAGFGATYMLGRNHGPYAEARLQALFGNFSVAPAIQVGYTYGF